MSAKKKILCILGTRPEAIKLFPVASKLLNSKTLYPKVVCVYQQADLLTYPLKFFPASELLKVECPRVTGDLIELTTILLQKLGDLFRKEAPDLVLVQGDTSTAVCASLAAFYLGIPVGHVEAGLRTFNAHNPFPEEAHRSIITHLAQWHFCPSNLAYRNVIQCGVDPKNVLLSGNTGIDALQSISADTSACSIFPDIKKPYFVFTVHRRENRIFLPDVFEHLIKSLLGTFASHQIIWVTHPSWAEKLIDSVLPNETRLLKLPPLPYEQFIGLLMGADVVLTDSGGVQEEITELGIPGIVLRTITDRPESLELEYIKVLGWSLDQIVESVDDLLKRRSDTARAGSNIFGDGGAAERIVNFLEHACGQTR